MISELTKKQQTALNHKQNTSVTAGAGTGKTLILVERYLDIVLNNEVDVQRVLAITFTDKAAGEMIERIRQRIEDYLSDSESIFNRKKLIHLRHRLNYAYISTVHSFCMRILKENPIAADVDPDFSVTNDLQTNVLMEEAIEQEMAEINNEQSEWLDLFRLYHPNS